MRDREIREAIQDKVALFVNASAMFEGTKGNKVRVRLLCDGREEHVYYGSHVSGRAFANKLGDVTRALQKISIPKRRSDSKKAVAGIGTLGEKLMEAVGVPPPTQEELQTEPSAPRFVATNLRLEPPLPVLQDPLDLLCPDAIAAASQREPDKTNAPAAVQAVMAPSAPIDLVPRIEGLTRPKSRTLLQLLGELLVEGGSVEVRDLQRLILSRMTYVNRQQVVAAALMVMPGATYTGRTQVASRLENVSLSAEAQDALNRAPTPKAVAEPIETSETTQPEASMQTPNTQNGAHVNGHSAKPKSPAPSGIKRQQMSHVMVIGATRLLDKHGKASSPIPKDATYTYADGWSDERVRNEVTPDFSVHVIAEFRKNNYGRTEEEIQRAMVNGPYALLLKENLELRQTVSDLEARLAKCEAICRQFE